MHRLDVLRRMDIITQHLMDLANTGGRRVHLLKVYKLIGFEKQQNIVLLEASRRTQVQAL
jgi:hypothetical protein